MLIDGMLRLGKVLMQRHMHQLITQLICCVVFQVIETMCTPVVFFVYTVCLPVDFLVWIKHLIKTCRHLNGSVASLQCFALVFPGYLVNGFHRTGLRVVTVVLQQRQRRQQQRFEIVRGTNESDDVITNK